MLPLVRERHQRTKETALAAQGNHRGLYKSSSPSYRAAPMYPPNGAAKLDESYSP